MFPIFIFLLKKDLKTLPLIKTEPPDGDKPLTFSPYI